MRVASIARSFTAGIAVAAGFALASCDGASPLGVSATTITDVAQARTLWEASAPREYSFVLEVYCFCPDLRAVIVRVRDGVVRDVRNADDLKPLPSESSVTFPSLEGIFQIVEEARAAGAYSVVAEFDAKYGYPRRVAVDPWAEFQDDGWSYDVSRVTPR